MGYKKCKDGNGMWWGRDIRVIGENWVGCGNILLHISEIYKNKNETSICTCTIKD